MSNFLDEAWELVYHEQAEELKKALETCTEEEKLELEQKLKKAKEMEYTYFEINNAGFWLPD